MLSTIKSWSHILLMLNKFTLKPSTYSTFAMPSIPGREMVPFPLICDLLPSLKVTLPLFLDSKTLKRDRSPVMCLEQLLSRYHKHVSTTLNTDFIMKHTSCLDDKSVGIVFSLICHLQTKLLTFTLLRWIPLYIFILRQSSFFVVMLRFFSNNHHDRFQITFRLAFSDTLNQVEVRKTRCIWNKRSFHVGCSHDNRGQWITQQRLTLIKVCLLWYHLIGQECIDPLW